VSDWEDFFGTIQRWAEDSCLPGPEVAVPAAGTLTLARLERWLNELWDADRVPTAVEIDDYAARAVEQPEVLCCARLFAPDESVKRAIRNELAITRTPVHPAGVAYLRPAQGPEPASCAFEPHPEGMWHWDGHGTWWR
jgi:hypothetical protein